MSKKDEKKPEPVEEGAHGFSVMLAKVDDGCLHAELSEELRELMKKLDTHANNFGAAAKGELTLKLSFSVDNGYVQVRGDVKTKAPPPKRGASLLYLTKSFNLSGKNPRQMEIPLHEVPRAEAPAKEVPSREVVATEA